MKHFTKTWRNSASLIVLIKNEVKKYHNFDLLMFKRSEKTSFMKNSIVFPGGATDKSDESNEWIKLYKKLGASDLILKQLTEVNGPRPYIYKKSNVNNLNSEISLRITAIRETFEELGVLICKTSEQLKNESLYSNFFTNLDVSKWQSVVHNDASQFLKLCQDHEIVPDLWNNYEWSAWLTPVNFPARFGVTFYVVALENVPEIFAEPNEVAEIVCTNPREIMEMHRNKKLWLPPPQIYEMLRIQQFKDIRDFISFAKNRNSRGLTLFFPMTFHTKDRWIQLLPGDDLYPKDIDYHKSQFGDKYQEITAENLRAQSVNLHRAEYRSPLDNEYELYMNIDPFDGHVKPLTSRLLNKF